MRDDLFPLFSPRPLSCSSFFFQPLRSIKFTSSDSRLAQAQGPSHKISTLIWTYLRPCGPCTAARCRTICIYLLLVLRSDIHLLSTTTTPTPFYPLFLDDGIVRCTNLLSTTNSPSPSLSQLKEKFAGQAELTEEEPSTTTTPVRSNN